MFYGGCPPPFFVKGGKHDDRTPCKGGEIGDWGDLCRFYVKHNSTNKVFNVVKKQLDRLASIKQEPVDTRSQPK